MSARLSNEDWKIISAVRVGVYGFPMELIAAKGEDGVGIMARWTCDGYDEETGEHGPWAVEVWHTEMPSEGLEDDDGGSVTEIPAFAIPHYGEVCPTVAEGVRGE